MSSNFKPSENIIKVTNDEAIRKLSINKWGLKNDVAYC